MQTIRRDDDPDPAQKNDHSHDIQIYCLTVGPISIMCSSNYAFIFNIVCKALTNFEYGFFVYLNALIPVVNILVSEDRFDSAHHIKHIHEGTDGRKRAMHFAPHKSHPSSSPFPYKCWHCTICMHFFVFIVIFWLKKVIFVTPNALMCV